MSVLVAEDDDTTRLVLERLLKRWGYDVIVASDGLEALGAFGGRDDASIVLVDWVMPGLEGPELCQRLRAQAKTRPLYVILLTGRDSIDDTVAGLEAGADDYLVKPFNPHELRARVRAGERVVALQSELRDRVRALEGALAQVKQLQGLLPICSYCKRIRDDREYWTDVEDYVQRHTDATFTHGICPGCYDGIVQTKLKHLAIARNGDIADDQRPS